MNGNLIECIPKIPGDLYFLSLTLNSNPIKELLEIGDGTTFTYVNAENTLLEKLPDWALARPHTQCDRWRAVHLRHALLQRQARPCGVSGSKRPPRGESAALRDQSALSALTKNAELLDGAAHESNRRRPQDEDLKIISSMDGNELVSYTTNERVLYI